MQLRCTRASYEQWNGHSARLHQPRHMAHLLKRRCDQPAQTYKVGMLLLGTCHYLLPGHHHTHICHIETVAVQYHGNYVLTYVMNIPLHGGKHYTGVPGICRTTLLPFYHGSQVADCIFHDLCALYHLRKKHHSLAEEVAHTVHTIHQRTVNHRVCRTIPHQCLIEHTFKPVRNATLHHPRQHISGRKL